MTPLLQEHDYIGLSEASSSTMESAAQKLSSSAEDGGQLLGSLRGSELRLSLPGSESPERNDKEKTVLTLGPAKSFTLSGAKRVFYDAIDKSGKWIFSGGSGSEEELGKGIACMAGLRAQGRTLVSTLHRKRSSL